MTKKKNKQKIYKDNKGEYIKNEQLAEGRYIAMKLISILKEIVVIVTLLATSSQAQWVRIPSPQASATVSAVATSGQHMYVGTWRGMAVSSDNGINWKKCHISETDTSVESIVTAGETIIVGIRNKGFLISTDKPKSGSVAVKVINHLGDEVMKVYKV